MKPPVTGVVVGLSLLAISCTELPVPAVDLVPETLRQGLVAHWRFDETEGSAIHDSSGNRRDGTLTGGQWLSDGKFGGALRLDQSQFASVTPFPNATSKFSVSAWVRIATYTQDTTDMGQWGTVVSTELGSIGGWEVNVTHKNPLPALNFGLWKGPYQGDYDAASCSCLAMGQWTQVVAIVDSDSRDLSFYVDGVLQVSEKVERGILPGSTELTIGQWPSGGRYLLGDVDDIAIWNRTLVPEEIATVYRQPTPDP